MVKTIILIFAFVSLGMAQWNLATEYDTTSTNDSLIIDLGIDLDYLGYPYSGGQELRAIGIYLHGTWTNDSLQVYAAPSPDSTYVPVYYDNAVVNLVGTTGNCYIAFKPWIFAGLRYILLKAPADEAANRLYGIVRRQY
jgi:hypothetical protein